MISQGEAIQIEELKAIRESLSNVESLLSQIITMSREAMDFNEKVYAERPQPKAEVPQRPLVQRPQAGHWLNQLKEENDKEGSK